MPDRSPHPQRLLRLGHREFLVIAGMLAGPIPEATNAALWFLEINYGTLLLVGLMACWDWRQGRLMKQFIVGASAILASEVVATTLYFWAPWKVLAIVWIEAWARTIG